MHTIGLASVMMLTVVSALGVGVGVGYLAISGILRAFGNHKREVAPATVRIHAMSGD